MVFRTILGPLTTPFCPRHMLRLRSGERTRVILSKEFAHYLPRELGSSIGSRLWRSFIASSTPLVPNHLRQFRRRRARRRKIPPIPGHPPGQRLPTPPLATPLAALNSAT